MKERFLKISLCKIKCLRPYMNEPMNEKRSLFFKG